MFKTLHRNIKIRIITSFMSRITGSMIFPFMAIYFTTTINASWASIFLIASVVVQFIASLYGGYLADVQGRKFMLVLSGWMKFAGFVGMALANSPLGTSAWITFMMMILINIASGFENPAAEAMLIDVSTKETRSFMYAINYWAVNMSLMLGLIIGGWFYESYLFQLFLALIVMSVVTLWMTIALIEECYTPTKTVTRSYGLKPILASYRTVIKDVRFLLFTLGGIAILSIEFQRNNYISVRLKEEFQPLTFQMFDFFQTSIDGVRLLSLLTVENTIMIVLFTAVVSKWVQNRDGQRIMYVGFILFALGYAWLAFSNNLPSLIVAVVILSIGELLYVPTRQAKLADIVDDRHRGAYMAFNGFVFQIGKMFGALGIIVGHAVGGVSMAIVYILFAVLAIGLTHIAMKDSGQSDAEVTVPVR
ncbi:MDR family MFS transporter [Radiobacillus sp. PE A8.2]|uniref:MDR family MFS transporter n=1 Tax=Radiobacillus sp. PE A8.2 TaxID=3380349 RepID=UPI00389116A1